ncbi:MAG: DUF3788 family protein [Bacteroidales bacterium]|jgi:hypothetical protein
MPGRDELILSDPQVVPTDEYIYSILGEKKSLWQDIIRFVNDSYKDITGSWNYYNDGKQWLFKLCQKKKTVFWAGMLNETFRVSFYFGDKAEVFLEKSDIPQKIKDDFKNVKRTGKLRAISVKVFSEDDIEIIKSLVDIKIKLK